MEITAKIARGGRQIRLIRPDKHASLISFDDARKAFEEGRVTKSNVVFQRLAEHDFDVQATIGWFIERQKRRAK